MQQKPLIQLKDIYKTYTTGAVSYEALKGITLHIDSGEYVAILGPSGSGKSTLMQIIGCLSTPSSGSYLLDGKEVSQLNRNELAKIRNQKVGFVFQNFNLLAQLDIVDNVALPLLYRGTALAERRRLAKEILKKLGLENHYKHHPNELSGGQKQRVAIARALVASPEIILADEPTGNLDTQSGNDVIQLFEQFTSEGKTVIVVTHDLEIAKRAKRIIHIQDGKIAN
ncbi:MAG: ABC transporter ATP-binding protein [Gammaproteobacteria bacterium]|nr:ABC transporter ATP-binding protein [Gammaproteobacteria bacterium]